MRRRSLENRTMVSKCMEKIKFEGKSMVQRCIAMAFYFKISGNAIE